ncbi:putative Transposon Ty3-G Gag-Pol polyprotein [Monocercomonoides exilis]|uniref:putative Transposon Ty3-G Gag-Pol polyprotein n=1 Tax=Monocercomonoides exilis TaxID=2049356 RepID=UPI00355A6498|nr:putative Transposon Ty3-G Gag-Pol polyprotein [Monocercomonoides exilis]|eukprot:MONOS_5062.1-p1 / transcript=MONOS_5062.1 / gene=MONOS_5062 / organism=Monocercomonoides_exilis_PA203 / gene_product=reverse transcriptase / transcript_product=reverse transcriptase / location=Mono_scaffold00143:72685-75824(+) / protein_length=931 / sequence_SO=supercontig / SO=protein_coding / is_pseudo=false
MDIENTATGPASGLGSIFALSGSTGVVGLSQPTSSSSVPPLQPAQSSSGDTSSDSSPNGKDIFLPRYAENYLADTVSLYESFSYTPFIPSKVHEFAGSSNWITDAPNSRDWRVERNLIQAVKALILTHADAPEKQERLFDAMMLAFLCLQEARHSRIHAEYGFSAAKALRVKTEDPVVSEKDFFGFRPEASGLHSSEREHQPDNSDKQGNGSEAGGLPKFNRRQDSDVCTGVEEHWSEEHSNKGRRRGCQMDTGELAQQHLMQNQRRRGKMFEHAVLHNEKEREIATNPDCRTLNKAINDIHFKSEDHKTLEKLLRKDDYAVTIDLSQAHFLVAVYKDFTPFLAFGFRERTFAFKGLPFGFKDARRIFTKLMRNVVKQVRKRWSARCLNYLDDIIILRDTKDALQKATTGIVHWFNNLGLVVNEEKSRLTPRKTFSFLGWIWKTCVMKVALETKRRSSLQKKIKRRMNLASKETLIMKRDFASLVGEISGTRFVDVDASLHMNRLYKELINAVRKTGWTGAMNLNHSIREQLQYWQTRLMWKEERPWVSFAIPDATLTTDAAPRACGATLRIGSSLYHFHQAFNRVFLNQSSYFRAIGKESPGSYEEDQTMNNRMEHSAESNSPPRSKELCSGCPLKTSTRRRLRDYRRSIKRVGTSARSFNRTGRLRKRDKQENNDLAWTRKSGAGRRTASRLERSGDSGASSDTSDSLLLKKASGRTGESSYSSPSLEEPGLDPSSERDNNILHAMERFEENIQGRTRNEEVGSITPTGTLLSSKTQLVAQRGEQWWNSRLRRCNVPEAIITEAKNSVSTSSWTANTFGFAHFTQAWTEENCGEFPQDFVEWCRRCVMLFVKQKEKGFPHTCLCATRSLISLFSRISYGEDIGQVPIIKTIFRSFHRSHVPRKPFTYMWSLAVVFDFHNSHPNNIDLSF